MHHNIAALAAIFLGEMLAILAAIGLPLLAYVISERWHGR